ncbi:MAG: LamG-like jellyroll fold domain-containing protein [Candidatus Micrarchaeia archaeon]
MQKKGMINRRSSSSKVHNLSNPSITKRFLAKASKAQSAMEYLMTYGWAILIIAVVLGALFQLGVFNANNFAPKAPPGACQIFRPNGPGTTSFLSLEGECQGELPEYVGRFDNSYIIMQQPFGVASTMPFTITAWIDPSSTPSGIQGVTSYGSTPCDGDVYALYVWNGNVGGGVGCPGVQTQLQVPAHTWSFEAIVITSSGETFYLDGQSSSNTITPGALPSGYTNYLTIGIANYETGNFLFDGKIANVQYYNASLSPSEIQALYQEGIGGAPIDLQNLVGWWPLNGNANDYSGNGNNGQISNVNFVSNWWQGYTPP